MGILQGKLFPSYGIIMGWILSGLAITMGASFWFDLLNKVINVRNTGPRPVSSANNEAANSQTAQNTSTRSGS
jgi:hypothetical protein